MSDSLQAHVLQQCRLPYFSLSPTVCSNSCPLNQWCHPTISYSVTPFSCLQSFSASGPFPLNQLFTSGGKKYWNFSFSINLSNEYSRLISFRIDWLDLLAVQGTLKSLLQHHSSKASILTVLNMSIYFLVSKNGNKLRRSGNGTKLFQEWECGSVQGVGVERAS